MQIVKQMKYCFIQKPRRKFISTLLLIAFFGNAHSQQKKITIQFVPKYASEPIEIGKKYPYKNDSIEIETLKFYISDIQFFQNNQLTGEVEKRHHLIDIENPSTEFIYQQNEKNIQFNRVRFSIGYK
jgi:hypothetical protein